MTCTVNKTIKVIIRPSEIYTLWGSQGDIINLLERENKVISDFRIPVLGEYYIADDGNDILDADTSYIPEQPRFIVVPRKENLKSWWE